MTRDSIMIFRSPFPSLDIPNLSVTAFALRHAQRLADKPALIDGATGDALTFGELAAAVHRTAVGLTAHGFGKGDVFAILAPNSIEFGVAFHAIASIGGITAPLNPQSTPDEVSNRIHETGAVCLVTTPELLEACRHAVERCRLREIVVFGDAAGATSFAGLSLNDGSPPDVALDLAEDVAVVLCSSGTTGLPKGVQLTHRNLVASARQLAIACDVGEGDTLPGQLPFFHCFGLIVALSLGLSQGATSVLMSRFDFDRFLELIQNHQISRAFVVPPIVLALAKQPIVGEYDLSSLVMMLSGAAPLGSDVAGACAERLGCRVKQGYGLTEIIPTHAVPERSKPGKLGTVGVCVPGVECKIIDIESGDELDVGETGEICVRGPQQMKGYLNRPEATAAMIDAEGWIHTGDVGVVDNDGYLTVVDRLKELIKYKGYQVAPAELEAILLAHPAVADAAVIPSPDDEAGEVPKAFVVLRGEATGDELMAFVADRVAAYKRVRRLEFVHAIPKSPTGKILRRVLVERERSGAITVV